MRQDGDSRHEREEFDQREGAERGRYIEQRALCGESGREPAADQARSRRGRRARGGEPAQVCPAGMRVPLGAGTNPRAARHPPSPCSGQRRNAYQRNSRRLTETGPITRSSVLNRVAEERCAFIDARAVADRNHVEGGEKVCRDVHVASDSCAKEPIDKRKQRRSTEARQRNASNQRLNEPPTQEIRTPQGVLPWLDAAQQDPLGADRNQDKGGKQRDAAGGRPCYGIQH